MKTFRPLIFTLLVFSSPLPGSEWMPIHPFADAAATEPPRVQELRSSLVAGSLPEQQSAAEELIRAGDVPSVLRMIYAVRQGSMDAAIILRSNANAGMIPYLMEDVAHGSMQPVPMNDADFRTVRDAATQIVVRALLITEPRFPEATREWSRYIACQPTMTSLPESSKFILDWWEHNKEAVAKGRFGEAAWLPETKTFSDNPWREPRPVASPPPPWQPPPEVKFPFQLSESFEAWADRVADAGRRNLSFMPLVWSSTSERQPNASSENGPAAAGAKGARPNAVKL